ncbi:MAG: tetratricopeptide repeat protein [Anaerolineae bacterium]|nr:tetratricopeptide repeat protein [Anaerolineae bacterium]
MAGNRVRYEEALNNGHSHIWDEKWEAAIKEFEVAAQLAPNEPAPYDGLGTAYHKLNRLDKALDNFKLAARYSRGDIIYLRQVADMQEQLGMNEDAGKTYMAIGEVELNRRRLNDAMDNWLRAVRLEPNLLKAHQRLASVYEKQGVIPNAIHEYLAIARILNKQGEREKALQACQLALRLDPRNADVLTAIEMIKSGRPIRDSAAPVAETSGLIGSLTKRLTVDGEGGLHKRAEAATPVQDAHRMAMEQLAGDLFGEGEMDARMLKRQALVSQALDFQRRGMTNEAISAYEQVMAAGVNSAAAHFNLGLLYQDKLRFEDAIKEFEFSVKDHEYRLASHFSLGECYRARGNIDKATEHFINVLKIVDLRTVQHNQADRLIELYENLAESLTAKGEVDQATGFANALVDFLSHKGWEDKVKEARGRLNTISDAGLMTLGDMLTAGSELVLESLFLSQEYARRGMFDTAVEEAYRAIQLSPDYLPAHVQLGDVLGKQGWRDTAARKFIVVGETYQVRGDANGAMIAYGRAVEFTPLDLSIRGRLIELQKRHGQIDRALEQYMAMGEAYYQLAQVDKARETYQEALKLAPRAEESAKWQMKLLRLTADIDMQRFDWRRALAAYKELRKLDPQDERTAIVLVDLYYKVGQPVNAVMELDEYLKQLVRSGRGNKVMGILEDMARQRPSDASVVERLSRLYVQQKRVTEAIELLDKLGEAQLEANDTVSAVETIQKILTLNPPNAASYQQLLSQLRQ